MTTEITHSCGHRYSHALHPTNETVETKSAWLTSQPCPDCYAAAKLAEPQTITKPTTPATLNGTPKQVEWAERIRRSVLENMPDASLWFVAKISASNVSQPIKDLAVSVAESLVSLAFARDSASVWIDQRDRADWRDLQRGGEHAHRGFTEAFAKTRSGRILSSVLIAANDGDDFANWLLFAGMHD